MPNRANTADCTLTRGVDVDFADAEPFFRFVGASNDDVAKFLRDWSAVDDDQFASTYCAGVPSTQRVGVGADIRTLGWEDIRQTDVKVVQTAHCTQQRKP